MGSCDTIVEQDILQSGSRCKTGTMHPSTFPGFSECLPAARLPRAIPPRARRARPPALPPAVRAVAVLHLVPAPKFVLGSIQLGFTPN